MQCRIPRKGAHLFEKGITLSKNQCPKMPEEEAHMRRVPYASMVGSLMYAMLCTRPDICYVVVIVSHKSRTWTLECHQAYT